jgi:hypothetical protein
LAWLRAPKGGLEHNAAQRPERDALSGQTLPRDEARAFVPPGTCPPRRRDFPHTGMFIELLHSFSHAPVEYKLHFDQSGYKLV